MSELPTGWAETSIGDVTAYVSRGKSPKYAETSRLPVINQKAIRWFGIQDENLKFIHEDQFDQWTPERFIQTGDVLWNSTGTGTIGRACLVRPEHLHPPKVVDSHVTIVRPSAAIDPRFLFAWIRGPEVQSGLEELASGSTNQIELNRSTVIATRVPLAPLPEQKRIADKLDAVLARVDACRGRLDRVPAILKRFRQSVLAAATSGELTREWREGAGAEWDEKSIEELCGVERYAMAIGPFGSNLKVADYRSEGVPLVFVREIRARTFGGPATKYVSPEKAVELKAHSVRPGDLLITKMGDPPGDTAIYPLDRPPAIMTADVVCLRVDPHIADSQFVGHAIESPLGRERMGEITAGVAQQKISLERLRTMRLPTPPVREQVEIARRVGELFELADQLERRAIAGRGCVDKLTPSLLAKAFRGELVPQDPNDEPASVLLARLKGAEPVGAKKRKGSAKA